MICIASYRRRPRGRGGYQIAELEAAEDQQRWRVPAASRGWRYTSGPRISALIRRYRRRIAGRLLQDDIPGYNPGGFREILLSGLTSGLIGIAITFGLIVGAMYGLAVPPRAETPKSAWAADRHPEWKLIGAGVLAVILGRDDVSGRPLRSSSLALAILGIPTALIVGWVLG